MRRDTNPWMIVATSILLVALSLLAWFVQPSAVDFAREALAKRMGVAADELELVDQKSFAPLSPAVLSTMTVEFQVKGAKRSHKRAVDLFRLVYFLPWWVSEYREGEE
jgi:hypothetical protein